LEIKDGKVPIEQQLSRIIAKLEMQGAAFRKEAIEREERHKRQEEQRLIKEAFEERKKMELASVKQAIKDAATGIKPHSSNPTSPTSNKKKS